MPFQSVWLDVMGMDGGPEMVVIAKAARCGYTEALKASMCYLLAEVRRNIIAYQPTADAAQEWARESIATALRDCDITAAYMDEDARDLRQKRIAHQYVGGKSVSVRGAVSPGNFRRIGADAIMMDELDGMPIDIGGEGSPVALAMRAMTTSRFRKMLLGSTPVDAGVSMIWNELWNAEAKLLYMVACPLCGRLGELEFERMRWDKRGTRDKRADSVRYKCGSCNRLWRQDALQQALEGGRWEVPAKFLGRTTDRHVGCWIRPGDPAPDWVGADGKSQPWPNSIGFHIWRGYSTLSPWRDIPAQLIRAGKNPLMLKAYQNHIRGLPWGGDLGAKSAEEVDGMRKAVNVLPVQCNRLFMAVDCQKEHLSVMLLGMDEDMGCWILSRDDLYGNPERDDGAAWAMLYDWLRDGVSWPVRRPGGKRTAQLPLGAIAVDTGGLYTQAVYRGCMRLSSICANVIPTKGASAYAAQVVKRSSTVTESGVKIPLYMIGTHRAKVLASHLIGRGTLAINQSCPRALNDELVSERLVLERSGGRMVHKWKNLGEANEAFDQLVMGVVLWTLSKPATSTAPRLSKFHAVKMAKGGVAEVSHKRARAADVQRRSAGVGRIGRVRSVRRI